ncbi:SpoIIE family protein phosphatase [Candidatus Poribacteria bacterium]|nr:SpoIIE family protein phosphatase [Candidatus Poribacteria bacterium]
MLMRNEGRTLKSQIVIMFLFIGLSPLFSASILAFYSSEKTLNEAIGKVERDFAIKAMDKIDREMENIRLLVENWTSFENRKVLANTAMEGQKKSYDELFEQWNLDGSTSTPGAHFLKNLQRTNQTQFKEIFLTDLRGYVIAATDKTSDFDQGPADDPPFGEKWWAAAKEKGEHIGEIAFDDSAGVYSVDINMSIKADDDETVGILKVVYSVENIRNLIGGGGYGTTRHYELLNRYGYIVAATMTDQAEMLEKTSRVVLPDNKEIWKNRAAKNGFAIGETEDGKVLMGWSRGEAWTVLTYSPLDVAHAPLRQQARWLIGVSAVATVIILLVALAVGNRVVSEMLGKELMAQEIQTAQSMQMGLLPEPLDISELDLAGRCLAANRVGGDYYNHLWMDDDQRKLAIVIADVAGHDMSAAIPAVMFSGMLDFAVKEGTPGAMLTALNQSLCQQPKRTPFITCCIAIIDLDEKQMQWSKAGHPEIYHYCTHKDAVEELTAESYPLGVSQKSDYSDETVHLHEGDLLILYTDGLPEAANPSGRIYGYNRLERSIHRVAQGGLSSMEGINQMIDDVRGFIDNTEPEDDITVVVAKVTKSQ